MPDPSPSSPSSTNADAFAARAGSEFGRPRERSERSTAAGGPVAAPRLTTLIGPVGGLLVAAAGQQPAVYVVAVFVAWIVVEGEPAERIDARPAPGDPQRVGQPARRGLAGDPEVELVVGVVGRPEELREKELD